MKTKYKFSLTLQALFKTEGAFVASVGQDQDIRNGKSDLYSTHALCFETETGLFD